MGVPQELSPPTQGPPSSPPQAAAPPARERPGPPRLSTSKGLVQGPEKPRAKARPISASERQQHQARSSGSHSPRRLAIWKIRPAAARREAPAGSACGNRPYIT